MAVTAGAYSGRVVDYTAISGYGTHGGLNTLFGLSTLEDGADPGALTDSVTVLFGDGDVAPGATVGPFTDFESFKSFEVRLPREAVHTFWRGIRDFQGQDQNQSSFLSITWNGNNDILGFAVVVNEALEGDADKDRRERNDELRRKVLDSWR